MAALHLDLLPREEFARFDLAQRNVYLQRLADEFCAKSNRPPLTLTREALSRLRRFYLRLSLADLERGAVDLRVSDPELAAALRRLGETIKGQERKADVIGMMKAELPAPMMREAPEDDSQLSLFIPALYEARLKDDLNLMDFAPFSLAKQRRTTMMRYELTDCVVTVDGSAEHGLATVFDYDIFLHMVSHLAEEMRQYHFAASKGLRPHLPPRVYQPNAAHILRFCRRSKGGRQYRDLEAALDRLAGTRIKIAPLGGGKRREVVNMPLIDKYRVVSETDTGHVDEIETYIPTWVYEAVVKEKGAPQILTLNPDYFLIQQGFGRVIYRLARRAAARTEARYSVAEIHKRSGSQQAPAQFAQMLRQFVASTKAFPLPDYDLELVDGNTGKLLHMRFRGNAAMAANDPMPLRQSA